MKLVLISKFLIFFLFISLMSQASEADRGNQKYVSWWDSSATNPAYLSVEFDCLKKLKSRRKPIKLTGDFLFRRVSDESEIKMNFYRKSRSGKKIFDNTTFISSEKWMKLTPEGFDGEPGELQIVDLKKRPSLRSVFQVLVMFYGLTFKQLNDDFKTEIIQDGQELWKLKLTPLDPESARQVEKIIIDLNKDSIEIVAFYLPRNESMVFTFLAQKDKKISDDKFKIILPKGTKVVEAEQEAQ